MNDLIKKQLQDAQATMDKAIAHCEAELTKIRAGKASAGMLDGIMVDYYGTPTALAQVGSINTPDARTLIIQPWEKQLLVPIERAIMEANIGINPQNDGVIIRLIVPPLTEERRKDLAKQAKGEADSNKIVIRNARQEGMKDLKKLDGVSEDLVKGSEKDIQDLTDQYVKKVDEVLKVKEAEILKV